MMTGSNSMNPLLRRMIDDMTVLNLRHAAINRKDSGSGWMKDRGQVTPRKPLQSHLKRRRTKIVFFRTNLRWPERRTTSRLT
jgi:hypothetical protein